MKKKPFKKYFLKKSVIICSVILAFALLIFYACLQINSAQLNTHISGLDENHDFKEIKESVKTYNKMQVGSEIVLVVFSVLAGSIVSALLIERRSSNKIVEEVFIDDFLTSPKFINMLDDCDKKSLWKTLQSEYNFNGCKEKGDMYATVIDKLNKPAMDGKNLYYEKYYLDIKCNITDKYIEKRIFKRVEMKSLGKGFNDKENVLLSLVLEQIPDVQILEINRVKINGDERAKNEITIRKAKTNNHLDEKRGYDVNLVCTYNNTLNFSNKKATKIELEYTTRCPLNDHVYTCRMQYPCKNFDFNYSIVSGENYTVSPSAFGFINDAKDSPNHSDDRRNVSIKFNEWIFPLDGVCVCLEKKVAKFEDIVYNEDEKGVII